MDDILGMGHETAHRVFIGSSTRSTLSKLQLFSFASSCIVTPLLLLPYPHACSSFSLHVCSLLLLIPMPWVHRGPRECHLELGQHVVDRAQART